MGGNNSNFHNSQKLALKRKLRLAPTVQLCGWRIRYGQSGALPFSTRIIGKIRDYESPKVNYN